MAEKLYLLLVPVSCLDTAAVVQNIMLQLDLALFFKLKYTYLKCWPLCGNRQDLSGTVLNLFGGVFFGPSRKSFLVTKQK